MIGLFNSSALMPASTSASTPVSRRIRPALLMAMSMAVLLAACGGGQDTGGAQAPIGVQQPPDPPPDPPPVDPPPADPDEPSTPPDEPPPADDPYATARTLFEQRQRLRAAALGD